LSEVELKKDYFVHQSSYVDDDVEIGEGTKIWHFCHILSRSRIGKSCIFGQNVSVGPDVTIGDRCKIQNNVSVHRGVTLEDEVFCGPSCVFTNVYNPRAFIERKHEFRPTLVRRGATIGANATIVCGVTIGRYALVAAGAVVKDNVPDYGIVAGVPARQVGWTCKCGTALKDNPLGHQGQPEKALFACGYCRNEYVLDNGKLIPVREA
jgi:UDP-2-acetamido-3-amino-2,3-dideoxy-glucuronate N-acetyltransferase